MEARNESALDETDLFKARTGGSFAIKTGLMQFQVICSVVIAAKVATFAFIVCKTAFCLIGNDLVPAFHAVDYIGSFDRL